MASKLNEPTNKVCVHMLTIKKKTFSKAFIKKIWFNFIKLSQNLRQKPKTTFKMVQMASKKHLAYTESTGAYASFNFLAL